MNNFVPFLDLITPHGERNILYPGLTEQQLARVAESIKEFISQS